MGIVDSHTESQIRAAWVKIRNPNRMTRGGGGTAIYGLYRYVPL